MPVPNYAHYVCALHPGQEVVDRQAGEGDPTLPGLPREQRWVWLFGEVYCPRAAFILAGRLHQVPLLSTEEIFAPDPDWVIPATARAVEDPGHLDGNNLPPTG